MYQACIESTKHARYLGIGCWLMLAIRWCARFASPGLTQDAQIEQAEMRQVRPLASDRSRLVLGNPTCVVLLCIPPPSPLRHHTHSRAHTHPNASHLRTHPPRVHAGVPRVWRARPCPDPTPSCSDSAVLNGGHTACKPPLM